MRQPGLLSLKAEGAHLMASLNGQVIFDVLDADRPLTSGAVALVCEAGRLSVEKVKISPSTG